MGTVLAGLGKGIQGRGYHGDREGKGLDQWRMDRGREK